MQHDTYTYSCVHPIVRKGISTLLHFKIIPHFLKSPPPPPSKALPTNRPSQAFLINRNTTVKLSSINTIHVKQQHVGFFIFKFTLKCTLGNVYINKMHATQCLYRSFSHAFNFCCIQRNQSRRRDFSMEQLPIDSYMLLCKQKNSIRIPLIKDALWSLRKLLTTENTLKMMKNTYFTSKALFILKIFKFLSWIFGRVAKWLDWKDKVNFKFYDVTAWLKNKCNTHIAQYLEK